MGFDFYPIFYPLEVSGVRFQPSRRPKKRPVKSEKKLEVSYKVSGIKMSKTKLKLYPAESLMIGFHHIFDI
jgi:hypothetical protein